MKNRVFCLMLVGIFLVAQSPIAFAQGGSAGWSRIQALGADERIIVKQKDGKTVEGRMIEASETNLTMSRSGKVVNISRDNIQQIQHSTGKAAKGKWAAIGAGIGAGTGAGIGALKSNATFDDGEIYVVVGTVFGAGAGAVGGLLFGASRRKRELIYTAP